MRDGRLDRRLFDVTSLIADDNAGTLPLLVTYKDDASARQRQAQGIEGERDITELDMRAVKADEQGRTQLWASLAGRAQARTVTGAGVTKVRLDGKRKLLLDQAVTQIGAPAAYRAGFDGRGVTVAVLDSGIDTTHPDFADNVIEAKNFTPETDATDTVGHGTHVASIIAGSGAASGGRFKGVAPGAKLLIGKVCALESCNESDIIAGRCGPRSDLRSSI